MSFFRYFSTDLRQWYRILHIDHIVRLEHLQYNSIVLSEHRNSIQYCSDLVRCQIDRIDRVYIHLQLNPNTPVNKHHIFYQENTTLPITSDQSYLPPTPGLHWHCPVYRSQDGPILPNPHAHGLQPSSLQA